MTYTFQLTDQDLAVIDQLLQNAPYRVAAPLVAKINAQLDAQEKQPKCGAAS